jgi:hypothetical protein
MLRDNVEIRVNVRTFTGSRLCLSEECLDLLSFMLAREIVDELTRTLDSIDNIQTNQDCDLVRDPDIQLDIEERYCRLGEIDNDCPICQEKFKLGEKLSTLDYCLHTFHFSCIEEWGRYKQECPLCRTEIFTF